MLVAMKQTLSKEITMLKLGNCEREPTPAALEFNGNVIIIVRPHGN
jgi:hypothetical protein